MGDSASHKMSRVVFVGNVPYDMEEDQLTPIFSTVGPIAGFRLMVDKETKKSKGYAFCEYYDHETAASAVRNLNGTEVAGRPLRIDLADSDPFLEGKTTTRGEFVGLDRDRREPRDPLAGLPPGAPVPLGSSPLDVISKSLAAIRPAQMMEIMGQMKAYAINYPDQARALLTAHPQLGYAFFQAMVMNSLVDPNVLQRVIAASAPVQPPPAAPVPPVMPSHPPPSGPMGYRPQPPPAPYAMPPVQQQMRPPPPGPSYGSQPPPPVPAPAPPRPAAPPHQSAIEAATADFPEDQKAMLLQILSLTTEQVNALPPTERSTVQQLRAQFGAM